MGKSSVVRPNLVPASLVLEANLKVMERDAEIESLRARIAELERKAARWDECERRAKKHETFRYEKHLRTIRRWWAISGDDSPEGDTFAAAIDASIAERAAIEARGEGTNQ
jgi:hydroxymethylpyrimidine/phosphomethylpyrimidine kinase